jgi:type II secretion system protein G
MPNPLFTFVAILILHSVTSVAQPTMPRPASGPTTPAKGLSTTPTTRSIVRPRDKSAMQFQEVATQLKAFKSACGKFPSTAQGFKALVEKPTELNCSSYPKAGFSKDAEPKDLWGHALVYTSDGQHYKILSLGADGKEGGEGVNMDTVITD